MIVVDASAALAALLNAGPARRTLSSDQLHVPHLIDSEIANGLRGVVAAKKVTTDAGGRALDAWRHMGVVRYPIVGILVRVWELRQNMTAYDASYVALA